MKNALELYRLKKSLSYSALARAVGFDRSTTTNHCKGEKPIGDTAALRYHVRLGIPLDELRPDLYGNDTPPP